MGVKSLDRWEPPKKKSRIGFRTYAFLSLLGVSTSIFAVSWIYPLKITSPIGNLIGYSPYSSEELAKEIRFSVSSDESPRVQELYESVSRLTSRVEALENERNRLRSEMNELAGDDGVIARIVTHVRALHAKIEATRHDVVDAMMSPLAENQPAMSDEGSELEAPKEGVGSPFLTKARHTIVTPVTAPSQVAEKDAPPSKHKAEPSQTMRSKGDTN